jgi:lipoic acid synthetase
MECYSKKTATFLALGKECSRSCAFCNIDFTKKPKAPEEDEPMVARDDLPDGGATHLSAIIREVRKENSGCTIEILTSDFGGNFGSIDTVLEESPEIFNHNIETVRSLTPDVGTWRK